MKQQKITTKKLVLTALFTALIMLATLFVRIPLANGYVNLGDAFIFASTIVLGPFWGTIAAAFGSAIADTIGYIVYAPATFLIKGGMAILFWLVYQALLKAIPSEFWATIIAGVVGTAFMTFGYFVFEAFFITSVPLAILNAPWTLLQGGVGVTVAIVLLRVLKATKLMEKFR